MYGDDLKHAINIINQYLQQGETIALWDSKDDDKSIILDKNSEIKFALWKFENNFNLENK